MNDESRPKGTASEAVVASRNSTSPADERDAAQRLSIAPLWVFRAILDAESRAFQRGYSKGRADHAAEAWEQSKIIVRNAAKSVDVMSARAKADAR